MKKIVFVTLAIVLAVGCSRETARRASVPAPAVQGDGKYDYMLTEALRQKYVGDMGGAVVLFEKCIETDKNRSVPYFELAQIYAGMGASDKAVKFASQAANLDRNNYWYQVACASLFTQFEMKDSALVYFKRALKTDPEAVEVYSALAGLYAEKGNYEEADSLFFILDRAGVLDQQMFLMMISGLMEEKKYSTAAERTISLIEKFPEEMKYKALLANIYSVAGEEARSDSIYTKIIESDPESTENQLLVLGNMVEKKEYAGASAFLSSVIKSDAIDRERKVALIRDLIRDSAYLESQSKTLEVNLITLEAEYPDDEEVLSIRPGMYEEIEKYDDATARYEELVKIINPGYFFKERLILLYARNEDYEKLYSLASAYATENNRSILGKIYYAIAAMELKKYDVAENELKKAMILAGNDEQLKLQVLSMLGDLKYRMRDFKAAYNYLEEALLIDPGDIMIMNNYAYFLAENGNELPKALKMIKAVIEKEKDNPTYLDTYAWVLYKSGKNRDAYNVMSGIMENSKNEDPELLEHMGYILKALGRCREAEEYWKKALEKDISKDYLKREIDLCDGQKRN